MDKITKTKIFKTMLDWIKKFQSKPLEKCWAWWDLITRMMISGRFCTFCTEWPKRPMTFFTQMVTAQRIYQNKTSAHICNSSLMKSSLSFQDRENSPQLQKLNHRPAKALRTSSSKVFHPRTCCPANRLLLHPTSRLSQ